MHSILKRQIDKYIRDAGAIPADFQELLKVIDSTYCHNDEDRALLERTLEISSREHIDQEHKLQEKEQKYRHIARETGQLLYVYNLETGQIDWAGAIETLTGYTSEEYSRFDIKTWLDMVHPDDRQKVDEELRSAISSASHYSMEYRYRRKDGGFFLASDNGSFITDDRNTPLEMLGAMTDITASKSAVEKQKFHTKELEDMNKLMINRELKMVELKEEIAKLKRQSGDSQDVGSSK